MSYDPFAGSVVFEIYFSTGEVFQISMFPLVIASHQILGESFFPYQNLAGIPEIVGFINEELEGRNHSSLFPIHLESFLCKLIHYTHKSLEDMHKELLSHLPFCSSIRTTMRADPADRYIVLEMVDTIDWYLHPPDPWTLEEICCKDMANNRTWMDLQVFVEEITREIGDNILKELVHESCIL